MAWANKNLTVSIRYHRNSSFAMRGDVSVVEAIRIDANATGKVPQPLHC